MSDLKKLLKANDIKAALIIDDVYDDQPFPGDIDGSEWVVFFDDLTEEEKSVVQNLYPAYESQDADALKESSEFVQILWQNRAQIAAAQALFSSHEKANAPERQRLDELVDSLLALGLSCEKSGRNLSKKMERPDIIFVDLFLGHQQTDDDVERSVDQLKQTLGKWTKNPPLIVLMSNSPRLQKKRNTFRDRAGLLGSMFRVASKQELRDQGKREMMLARLAAHHKDARKFASFIHSWEVGLEKVRQNFVQTVRKLDLADLAQIQALLLDFEGQQMGEYLLDVLDRVLQYKVEADQGIMQSAKDLNTLDADKYPPSHLEGSGDLQALVHQMMFLNEHRLGLADDNGVPRPRFGDLLQWVDVQKVPGQDVSMVVTPACDLIRENGRAERVMLLSGQLHDLTPSAWYSHHSTASTAIVILPGAERKWIKWHMKNAKALDWNELEDSFSKGEVRRIGRFREIYALEIQRKFLETLGRVGTPADPPAAFPVEVELFYVDQHGKAQQVPPGNVEQAVCYVGRDESTKSKPVHRLVLTEQACDSFQKAVENLDKAQVHPRYQQKLGQIQTHSDFFLQFEGGEVRMTTDETGATSIKLDKNKKDVVAQVMRNQAVVAGQEIDNKQKVPIVVRVTDRTLRNREFNE